MTDIEKVTYATEHIAVQLEKAHSLLDEISTYFDDEEQLDDLPRMAKHISNLLHILDDYVLDAAEAAKSAAGKAQGMIEIETEETIEEETVEDDDIC